MKRIAVIVASSVLFLALAIPGGGDQTGEPATEEAAVTAAVERAREATASLVGSLMQRLSGEMKEGGTAAALAVCAEAAQPLSHAAAADGLTIRRVSTRVRNPADRPDPYEAAVLAELAEQSAAGALPRERHEVVEGPEGRELRYLAPIVVKTLCLRCHGATEELEPEVRERLAELYPEDEAVGYAAGDLRGAVSVRVALGDSPQR